MDTIKWHPIFNDYGSDENGTIYSKRYNICGNQSGIPKPMKSSPHKGDGYLQFVIRYNGVGHTLKVHRFVYECFSGKCPMYGNGADDMTINHINGVRTDNRIVNLELVTKLYNVRNRLSGRSCTGHQYIYPNRSGYVVRFKTDDNHAKCFGTYSTIQEAIQVRNLRFKEYYPNDSIVY